MFRDSFWKTAILALIAIMIVLMCVITGCGNNSSDTTASLAQLPPDTAPKVAASGPAISDKLKFDQLALETPVKTTTDKNGLVFLEFQYADNNGKVYKCRLPKAMSEGEYTPGQWVGTFNVYRLPEVVKQKKLTHNNGQAVIDFPFIAPKPQNQEPNANQNGATNIPASGQMPSPP